MKKFFSSSFLLSFPSNNMHAWPRSRNASTFRTFRIFIFASALLRPTTNIVVVFALLLFVISFLLSCTFAKSYIAILSFFFSFSHTHRLFTMQKILYYMKMRLFQLKRCCLMSHLNDERRKKRENWI